MGYRSCSLRFQALQPSIYEPYLNLQKPTLLGILVVTSLYSSANRGVFGVKMN